MKLTLSLVAWFAFAWLIVHTAGWLCAVGVLFFALLVKLFRVSSKVAS